MTQLQEAIRDKITKYSDACGMCTDTTKECDTCSITCMLEDLNELQRLANRPDAVRPTAHWIKCDLVEVEHGECTRYKDAGIKCSKCNHVYDKFALWDGTFCPGCGSRMIECEDGEHR